MRRLSPLIALLLLLSACAACDAPRLNARDRPVALIVATTTSSSTQSPALTSAGDSHTVAPRASRSGAGRAAVRPAPIVPFDLSALLDRLAMCESGGNPRASGQFHGAFQFMLATWRSLGGTGLPEEHSYAEQKAVAARIPVSSWHSQFPVCSRRISV